VIVLVTTQKQFVSENKRKLMIDERLEELYKKAGYAGVNISKVPLGHQITIYAENQVSLLVKRVHPLKTCLRYLNRTINLRTRK